MVWREGMSRVHSSLENTAEPINYWRTVWRERKEEKEGVSLENTTDPVNYWRTVWRGTIRKRRGHVQPHADTTDTQTCYR